MNKLNREAVAEMEARWLTQPVETPSADDANEPAQTPQEPSQETPVTSGESISQPSVETPGKSVTKKCAECQREFTADNFGDAMKMVRAHRKEAHLAQPADTSGDADATPGRDAESAVRAASADVTLTPKVAAFRQALAKVLIGKGDRWLIDTLVDGAIQDPGPLGDPARLFRVLDDHGLDARQVRAVMTALFGWEASHYTPRFYDTTAPGQPYGQPAQADPAIATLAQRVDQLANALLGNREEGHSDRELELTERALRAEGEVARQKEIGELRSQLAKLEASMVKPAAPKTAEGEVEDRRSDRLLRVLDRVDRRAASGFAIAQAMMMKQMGYSDAQIADAVRVAQQTMAGDAAEDDPKAAAMRREMAKKWVREGALETAPANPGGVVPAFSFPTLPPWPMPQPPKPPAEEPARPDPAQWCSCHAIVELPKEAWGYEARHEQYCRWVQELQPKSPPPKLVTL